MKVEVVHGDLSETFVSSAIEAGRVAWDIETTGLNWKHDRIATCQVHVATIGTEVVQLDGGVPERMVQLLKSHSLQKVFHHAAFDLRFMRWHWQCSPLNVACTKVLAKITRPYEPSQHHSLKYLTQHLLNVQLDKGLQTSDWAATHLTDAQTAYAAADVEHLLPLHARLYEQATDSGLKDIVDASFDYLPIRVETDVRGCGDIFSY